MKFFRSLYNSLWNLSWLKQQKNAGGAFRYFLLFILLVTMVGLVPVAILLPDLARDVRQGVERLPDFTAQLKNGTLQVSDLSQPYVSWEKETVFVIDTMTTSSVSLESYFTTTTKSGVLITSDRMETIDRASGKEKIQPFRSLPDYAVTKSEVITVINRFTTPLAIIGVILFIAVLFYFGIFIAKLWSLVVVAGLVWVITKIINRSWKFGELTTVGLYAITLPTIISLVLTALNVQIPFIHFLAFLAFMIALVITNDGETAKIDAPTDSV